MITSRGQELMLGLSLLCLVQCDAAQAPPLWRMETSRGPVHFEQGQGQQARPWDCSFVLTKYLDQHPEASKPPLVPPGFVSTRRASFGILHVAATRAGPPCPGCERVGGRAVPGVVLTLMLILVSIETR